MFCNSCGAENPEGARFCSACGLAAPEKSAVQTVLGPIPSLSAPAHAPDVSQTQLGLAAGFVLADRYRVVSLLGVGGMGRVYLCEDQKLAIQVAVKVLHEALARDPGAVKRLIAEARHSIRLAHPNVVRVNNFEDGEMVKFLVMEYVEGQTLAHLIADHGKLDEVEVRKIAIGICKGLEHAHAKKVIHRDIKPGNILLGKDGSIKIADFGIARECRDSLSRITSQVAAGTLLYMAPEQLDGEGGERSDLYSLGVVLYEMLSGDVPFRSGDVVGQIRTRSPKPLPGVSSALAAVVMRCLEKKAENRFGSALELYEALRSHAAAAPRKPPVSARPDQDPAPGPALRQNQQPMLHAMKQEAEKQRRQTQDRIAKQWDDFLKKP
jgi:eukaryotic-like serine/threonine-protein kinase